MHNLFDYDYKLPRELIAQTPIEKREDSRLLVLGKTFEHNHFYDIADILHKDDVLVLNNSKVIPVRLFGKKESGSAI